MEEFKLEFGQLHVVHVDLLSAVLLWAIDDDVSVIDHINDGLKKIWLKIDRNLKQLTRYFFGKFNRRWTG